MSCRIVEIILNVTDANPKIFIPPYVIRIKKDLTMLVSTKKTSIMLQIARGIVADVQEQSHIAINILFDSCSQKIYVTERIAKILSLEPTSRQNVTIKTFGHNGKELDVGEYEFC